VNPLQALIREQMERKGWSYEQIEERARRAGHQVSKSTVHTLATRRELRRPPTREILQGLAEGLDLPLVALQRATLETLGWRLYYEHSKDREIFMASVDELPPDEQEFIKRMVDALREKNQRKQNDQ
jgi:transcriptional regulator with XRE-family HTH domain